MTLTVWNPFVVERLGIGHWTVLLGYGVLPWLVIAGRRSASRAVLPAAWLLVPLGSLSATAGVVSAIALGVCGWPGTAHVLGLWSLRPGGQRPVAGGRPVARRLPPPDPRAILRPPRGGRLPAPLAALGLGGIWNAEVVPGSRQTFSAGWPSCCSRLPRSAPHLAATRGRGGPAASVLGAGFGVAVVTWACPGVLDRWRGVPGAALLRDGSRSSPVPALVRAVDAGGAGRAARRGLAARRDGAAAWCSPSRAVRRCLGPVGGLRALDYPGGLARGPPGDGRQPGDLLVLPFTAYRTGVEPRPHGARPAGALPPDDVVGDDVDRVRPRDWRRPAGAPRPRALARRPEARARARGRGIRTSRSDAPAPGAAPDADLGGSVVAPARWSVVRLEAGPRRRSPRGPRAMLGVAWAAFVGVLLVGCVRLGPHRCDAMVCSWGYCRLGLKEREGSHGTSRLIASIIVGGTVAAVTIVGLISSSVDSPSDHPGNVTDATVPYGTTNYRPFAGIALRAPESARRQRGLHHGREVGLVCSQVYWPPWQGGPWARRLRSSSSVSTSARASTNSAWSSASSPETPSSIDSRVPPARGRPPSACRAWRPPRRPAPSPPSATAAPAPTTPRRPAPSRSFTWPTNRTLAPRAPGVLLQLVLPPAGADHGEASARGARRSSTTASMACSTCLCGTSRPTTHTLGAGGLRWPPRRRAVGAVVDDGDPAGSTPSSAARHGWRATRRRTGSVGRAGAPAGARSTSRPCPSGRGRPPATARGARGGRGPRPACGSPGG